MNRGKMLAALRQGERFDLLVVGGGATGCGVALDAASRGLRVALVEKGDFASGTSGRSTKLVHGGLRYLEAALLHGDRVQFNLVRDALRERRILLELAPHLCHRITLVIPLYRWGELPYYGAGTKLYDLLARKGGLGPSRLLGKKETLALCPMLKEAGLKGGILYRDGQFNDARMNLALARTAMANGAVAANYLEVTDLLKERGTVCGVRVADSLTGESWEIRARCVINACGPLSDRLRLMDQPGAAPLLRVSSGVHLVLDRKFPPPPAGITIPRTEDGRVLFILPWQGRCMVGTTDREAVPCDNPVATQGEIEYLLRHLQRYLGQEVTRSDVKSAWAGLRPLLQNPGTVDAARLARDHAISRSPSGLITIAGGKWTTYRKMARDTVDFALHEAGREPRRCRTDQIKLHGVADLRAAAEFAADNGIEVEAWLHLLESYWDQAEQVARLCAGEMSEPLAPGHPFLKGEVLHAVRHEMALRPADILMRRTSLALIDREAAIAAAPIVLELMAKELFWDQGRLRREREELALQLTSVP